MNTNELNNIPEISDLKLLDIDTGAEWEKFASAAGIGTRKNKVFSLKTFLKAAACIVAVAGVALTLWKLNQSVKSETFCAENQIVEATVENSTKISLNKNSSAVCSKDGNVFSVNLKGQAYFDVEKNPEREFRVTTEDLTLVVHGTSFDVCQNGDKTVVTVTSGNVGVVNRQSGESVQNMTKGCRVVCSKDGKTEVSQVENFNSIAWKLKKFEFENSPMRDVAAQLASVYGFSYSFDDSEIEKMTITGVFDNQSLESVFSVLRQTLDIKIEKDNKGCFKIKK